MQIVMIEWEDSCSNHGWTEISNATYCKPAPCVTAGIVIHEDSNKITVGLTVGEGTFSESMTIPRGCIKRIRKLKVS